ncbi:MAG TPA: response regulator transcription factor [Verrucomicrobiae bacterium]|jgi:DNA-binding response OmpR family regulator|nr:response regulator transcription factor [Verrucomicrobiae bacterium]
MDKILVIDNDSAVQKILRRTLVSSGFQVAIAADGRTALALFNAEMPRVVILEPHIPGFAGEDFCREIRRRSLSVPILVLSAAKAEIDKVVLLELGADDYVTKPFSPRELLARVRAAVRRLKQDASNSGENHSFGNVQVNFSSMEVLRAGVGVQLTPQEFKMLRFFLDNAGRVISDDELLQQVWDNRAHPGSRTIATHVLRLRQKLEENPAKPTYIRTVHGAGYKFLK